VNCTDYTERLAGAINLEVKLHAEDTVTIRVAYKYLSERSVFMMRWTNMSDVQKYSFFLYSTF